MEKSWDVEKRDGEVLYSRLWSFAAAATAAAEYIDRTGNDDTVFIRMYDEYEYRRSAYPSVIQMSHVSRPL